jgi:predicted acylesterase/phospholipase RssA
VSGSRGQIRIGLTISGAIALGAYEAGVLAALLAGAQAVNKERKDALRIDAMAGASAGSMTALLATRTLLAGLDPIAVMYRAWVETPQLKQLEDKLDSPLTVDPTRAVAEELLKGDADSDRAQTTSVKVNFALACLRGLDYELGRIGGPPVRATTYLDWAEWEIGPDKDVCWYSAKHGPLDAALASGAHAAAFPPYLLNRAAVRKAYEENRIVDLPETEDLWLWYTDGGTIDNEPLGRALDMTSDLDRTGADPLGGAGRLLLLITPDPARPVKGADRWSVKEPRPTWTRTGLRVAKLLRSQHLYDDLRRVEKTNSRIEWVGRLEDALIAIIEDGADPVEGLGAVSGTIAEQKGGLDSPDDFRADSSAEPDTDLRQALRDALGAATGLAGKQPVDVSVVSPLLLPEVANNSKSVHDVLAGEFLAHFGGFLAQPLRENDFAVGYRSMLTWLESADGLAAHGLDQGLAQVAFEGACDARKRWEENAGREWESDLGKRGLADEPFRTRFQLGWLGFRVVRILKRQLKSAAGDKPAA